MKEIFVIHTALELLHPLRYDFADIFLKLKGMCATGAGQNDV